MSSMAPARSAPSTSGVASTLEHKGAERLIEALDCKRRQRRHAERAMQDVVGYISTEEAARRSGYHVNHIAVLARRGRLLGFWRSVWDVDGSSTSGRWKHS